MDSQKFGTFISELRKEREMCIRDRDNSVDSFSNSIRVHISALRKKLRAALG